MGQRWTPADDGPEMVTATEIASFVCCREQWRLAHGLDLPSSNQPAMDAGRRHHGRNAAVERSTGCASA